MEIFVDADACPVKEEIYRVARRYGLKVRVVANAFIALPAEPLIERVFVEAGPDKADDWITEHAKGGDIVITADIPLAQRALAAGAAAIAPNGRAFTANSIGAAMASRAIAEHIRSTGGMTGGPPPFQRSDRSRFLQALDEAIQRQLRRGR